jgi:hypothetical protein
MSEYREERKKKRKRRDTQIAPAGVWVAHEEAIDDVVEFVHSAVLTKVILRFA